MSLNYKMPIHPNASTSHGTNTNSPTVELARKTHAIAVDELRSSSKADDGCVDGCTTSVIQRNGQ